MILIIIDKNKSSRSFRSKLIKFTNRLKQHEIGHWDLPRGVMHRACDHIAVDGQSIRPQRFQNERIQIEHDLQNKQNGRKSVQSHGGCVHIGDL